MRKLFLFFITTVLLVFSSYGQRTGFTASGLKDVPVHFLQKNNEPDTLLPGNWASAAGAALYSWEEARGYVFGTNLYGDRAYAQRFDVDEPYEIVKAIFWIGEKFGETGEAVFSVWNFNGMYPGDLLASVSVSLQDIIASQDFQGAMVVEFDEPVYVTSDYLIGADISGLEAFDPGVYGLGNYSSTEENGTNLGYAYVLEGTMWVPVLNYDLDVDIAIFPLVNFIENYDVTLNVDLTGLEGFDPDSNKVYVSGSFNNWIEPGTVGAVELTVVPRENEEDPLIYTCTLENVRVGDMFYKYFSDVVGEGWEGGEWEGENNRYVFVQENLVLNDLWGEPSVGIEEGLAEQAFRVYPNPARDVLYIKGNQPVEHLRLFDITGRLVFEQRALGSETSLDTGWLGKGIYVLQLKTGQQVRNHKIQVMR